MKKLIITVILILSLLLSACTGGADETSPSTGEATQQETTQPPPDTSFIPQTLQVSFPMAKAYSESVTERSDEVTYKTGINVRMTYESTFYGHDSAINRDYMRYGARFDKARFSCDMINAPYFIADFNGDRLGDIVYYENESIYIRTGAAAKSGAEGVFITDTNTRFGISSPTEIKLGARVTLRGAGDFNADGYTDLFFVTDTMTPVVYFGADGAFEKTAYAITLDGETYCGDFDGDGLCDIAQIDLGERTVRVYTNTGEGFTPAAPVLISAEGEYTSVSVADMNTDLRADLVLYGGGRIMTLFGRGEGRFGVVPGEADNKNLYSVYESGDVLTSFAAGDISGDTIPDICAMTEQGAVLLYSIDEPAYDYSMDVLKTDDGYRIYSGCRWYDENLTAVPSGDGDHVMLTTSTDGKRWFRHIDAPMFYLGWELGIDDWYSGNTLEPEVIIVDGVYHMYWQCSYTTPSGGYGDKIGYASSTDGINWTRKTDSPAIVCDNPEVGFNHEEVIYVADDPDNKPYWMYVGHFIDNTFHGYIRIRSSQPDRFEWDDREATSGIGQIGNQIGYISDCLGSRLFLRITFTEVNSKTGKQCVPTFQVSRDGLTFRTNGKLRLAGVDTDNPLTENNRNAYFLGMSTINGTGEIEKLEDGSYRIIYVMTSAKASTAPEIFLAEGGWGEVIIKISEI